MSGSASQTYFERSGVVIGNALNMWKLILVSVSVVLAAAKASTQFYLSAPLIASPYTSAYLSASAPLVAAPAAPVATSVVASAYPTVPALPTVPAAAPAAYPAVPVSSVSAYSYGSSYNIQDYLPVVNPAPAASLTYSLPYAYAGDYYYRR